MKHSHTRTLLNPAVALLIAFACVLLAACGGDGNSPAGAVVISTVTPFPTTQAKGPPPGATDPAPPAAGTTDVAGTTAPAPTTAPSSGAGRPATGHWIDVDVTRFEVKLMDGASVLQTIAPAAVGEQIDTGAYESTQTGLFHVYIKTKGLAYDPPYDTYISDWVGFDPGLANGFHSFLKDQTGKVVDASTGRISNGCIRTGEAEAIFAFAEIGMPVYVHT